MDTPDDPFGKVLRTSSLPFRYLGIEVAAIKRTERSPDGLLLKSRLPDSASQSRLLEMCMRGGIAVSTDMTDVVVSIPKVVLFEQAQQRQ